MLFLNHKKPFRDLGSGFDYYPIDYGRTIAGLYLIEIKQGFDLV